MQSIKNLEGINNVLDKYSTKTDPSKDRKHKQIDFNRRKLPSNCPRKKEKNEAGMVSQRNSTK